MHCTPRTQFPWLRGVSQSDLWNTLQGETYDKQLHVVSLSAQSWQYHTQITKSMHSIE